MVPLQYFLLTSTGVETDLALRIALGTSLTIIIPTAISGAYSHQRELRDILKIGISLGIFGMFGGILGGVTSSYIPSNILGSILGIFLIFTSIFMVLNKKLSKNNNNNNKNNINNTINNIRTNIRNNITNNIRNNFRTSIEYDNKINDEINDKTNDEINNEINYNIINKKSNEIKNLTKKYDFHNPKLKLSIIFGIIVGFSSGLLGIGGGMFLIPLLVLLGFSLRKSIAISSIFISLTAIGGAVSYIFTGIGVNNLPYSIGYVSLVNFGVIILFSIPMAYFGAKLAYKIPEKRLNQIFAILVFYMGIKMLGLDPISYILGI